MADSKRQKIVDAFDAQMRKIRTSEGYETDIGKNVFWWKPALETDALDGMVCRDTTSPINVGESGINQESHNLSIEVSVFVIEDDTEPIRLRKAIADIFKAIGINPQWNGLAEWTQPIFANIGVDQKGQVISGGLVEVAITYTTNLFDPYS